MLYSRKELDHLNWWRGILAFIVCLAHLLQILWYPLFGTKCWITVFVGGIANTSVVFFFVISGALIAQSAQKLEFKEGFHWRTFLVNRVTRIYPSLIIVFLICLILVAVFPWLNNYQIAINTFPSDLYLVRKTFNAELAEYSNGFFMLHPGLGKLNGPLWSLIIEWWLYMSAMFLFLAKSVSTFRKYMYYACALSSLWLAYDGFGFSAIFYVMIWYLGFYFTLVLRKNTKLMNYGFAIIATIFGYSIMSQGLKVLDITKTDYRVYGITQLFYSYVFLKFGFFISGKKLFHSIAPYSYTLYILHFPITLFVFAILRETVGNDWRLLLVESVLIIFLNLLLARCIAVRTENKLFFRIWLKNLSKKFNVLG